ncbi:MAG: DUF2183 domain-containing protein [Ferruginibacter sp.]
MSWKKKLFTIAAGIDEQLDNLKEKIKTRFHLQDDYDIIPFRTYGTADHIYVRGRLVEKQHIEKSAVSGSTWSNLVNMYRRFETDEVPGAEIKLTIAGIEYTAVTDHEGYFIFSIKPVAPQYSAELYNTYTLAAVSKKDTMVFAEAEVMIPPAKAGYGIISDVDDTIIQTGATDLTAMLKTVLFSNAKTRLPFEGVTEFYKKLQLGKTGNEVNPFFYVSSGPWNLYDLITDFMDIHEIPQGPLLLRDFGIRSDTFLTHDYLGHKFKEIKQVLDTYPSLNFILIGDSGEQDPVIYYEVVKHFPGRILAVYIRDMDNEEKRTVAVEMAAKMKDLSVEMVLTPHSAAAMAHAKQNGFIV